MSAQSLKPADLLLALGTGFAFVTAIFGGLIANNLEFVNAIDVPRPFFVLLALGMLPCALCYWRGWKVTLFVWPLAVYLFFLFGLNTSFLLELMLPFVEKAPAWANLLWLAPILSGVSLVVILGLGIYIFRRVRPTRHAAWILLFFAIGSASLSAKPLALLLWEASLPDAKTYLTQTEDWERLRTAQPEKNLPDVIVIVPDRYPSNRVLRETFLYDNTAFTQALARRGFVVLEDLRANYPITLLSLMSSLNMQNFEGTEALKVNDLYAGLRRNLVAQTFTQHGYEYVHLGGWAGFTMRAPLAQRIYNGTHLLDSYMSELEVALARLTPLHGMYITFRDRQMAAEGHDTYECQRLKRQIDYLKRLERSDQPLFAWAHIYIPHNPITMDAQGNCLAYPLPIPRFRNAEEMENPQAVSSFMKFIVRYRQLFIDYMEVLNREILRIYDLQYQHSQKQGRELIFVILSDEGSYPILWAALENRNVRYQRSSSGVLREKFGVFAAVYAPQIERSELCALKSRVNVWRTLLGNIMEVDLPEVDDVAYIPSSNTETVGDVRQLKNLKSVRERLGPQQAGGAGCEDNPANN